MQLLTETGIEREMMILSKSPSLSGQQPRDFCPAQPLLAPFLQGKTEKYTSKKRTRFEYGGLAYHAFSVNNGVSAHM